MSLMTHLRIAALAGPTVAVLVFIAVSQTHAYPGDVFVTGPPAKGPDIKTSTEVPDNSWSVSSQTGAARYSYPIAVPPGRAGMEPSLELSYSSQAPLRGGVAAGFSLDIPVIEVDTSIGRLAGVRYRSSLAGGQPLVEVDEPTPDPNGKTYRARNDASFARYQRFPEEDDSGYWRVLMPDGTKMYFGETSQSRDRRTWLSDFYADEGRWMLTRVVDEHGNQVTYHYETVYGAAVNGTVLNSPVDIALTRIEYTANRDHRLAPHARLHFEYAREFDLCAGSNVPIGAQFTFANGFRTYRGARRLDRIRIESRQSPDSAWQTRREIELGYDMDELACTVPRAPLRLLTSIKERAYDLDGAMVEAPPVTFEYGTSERQMTQELPLPMSPHAATTLGDGHRRLNKNKAGGWPTVDSMWLDINGDGRPDVLESPDVQTCDFTSTQSTAAGDWTDPIAAMWPSLPWADTSSGQLEPSGSDSSEIELEEGCNLGHQLSRRTNLDNCASYPANYTSFRLVDLDGDGVPELLTSLDAKRGRYQPGDDDLLYEATYGGTPICPTAPAPCRNSDGQEVSCSTSGMDSLSYAPDNTDYSQGCPEGECQSPVCFCGFEEGCPCPCDKYWCDLPSLDGLGSAFERPDKGEGLDWHGPPYYYGTVGDELTAAPAPYRPLCQYQQEAVCDRHVWRIYRWDSTSQTFSNPELVLAPIPLESERETTPISSELPITASAWHTLVDIDGDGCLDAAWQQPTQHDPEWAGDLQVFRGDCQGNFSGDSNGEPYYWPMPPLENRPVVSLSSTGAITNRETNGIMHRWTEASVTLTDINGDGLPDYVVSMPLTEDEWQDDPNGSNLQKLRVYYNTGAGFENIFENGTELSTTLRTMSRTEGVVFEEHVPTRHLEFGFSMNTFSPMDVDNDGLTDIAELIPPLEEEHNPWKSVSSVGRFHVNLGDHFRQLDFQRDLGRLALGLAEITVSDGKRWQVKTGIRDFDGDGLPDLFANDVHPLCEDLGSKDEGYRDNMWSGCGWSTVAHQDPEDARGAGKRFLRTIENGAGATISFDYGPASDPDLVQLDLESGHRLPQPLWVARSMEITTEGTAGGDPSIGRTELHYRRPVFNEDADKQMGFRGFEEVRVQGPENATGRRTTIIERFDYELDYSGRQVEELVFDGERLESIESTDWLERSLFDGQIVTYHIWKSRSWTCSQPSAPMDATEREDACRTDGALKRVINEYRRVVLEKSLESDLDVLPVEGDPALIPAGDAVMHVLRARRITESAGAVLAGDRAETRAHKLVYKPDRFHLLETARRKHEALEDGTTTGWGATQVAGAVRTVYDAAGKGLPKESHVAINDETVAITTRTFGEAGNLLTVQKPEQQGSTQLTSYSYEPFGIHVDTTINELGHTFETDYDIATGLPIRAAGPQQSQGWPTEVVRYDGFGREVERKRTRDNGNGYELVTISDAKYVDTETPRRAVTRSRLDYDADDWIVTETLSDGLGRPVVKSTLSGDWPASTRYRYDGAGNVIQVELPNPTGDKAAALYRYRHDGLGRVLEFEPPMGAVAEFDYDGLEVTQRQKVSDTSAPSRKTLTTDVFGRLRLVAEATTDGPDAITTYAYDGNDNMSHIVDADGIETLIEHDMVGNRTAITRAGRTWRYHYDRNGNMYAFIAPHDGDPIDDGLYTTTTVYDALDRPLSRLAAQRDLTDSEMKRYHLGEVAYDYDEATHDNGQGRLTSVTLPFGSITYDYTAEGWVAEETRDFMVGPFGMKVADKRTISRTYNALGLPVHTVHADQMKGQTETVTEYDGQGLPKNLYMKEPGGTGEILLAHLIRNHAQLVTARLSDFSQGQSWEYDPLGRVANSEIRNCPGKYGLEASKMCVDGGGALAGGETMAYWDSGNVRSVTDPASGKKLSFTYDRQHQLATATSSPDATDYAANFEYSQAGRVMSTYIGSSAATITSRDVEHIYPDIGDDDAGDPAAVSALRHAEPDAGELASLDYDFTGNLTERATDDETWTFRYDGDDRLREASTASASEVYYYDHNGQRMLSVRTPWDGERSRAIFWFGETEITYDDNGKPTEEHVFAALGGMPVARITRGERVALTYSGTLGHLLTVLDNRSELIASYRYSPFGELLESTGPAANDFRRLFNGKELDQLSALSYYGYRYYDRLTLSWTQADPLYRFAPDLAYSEPRRMGLYIFTANNPIRFLDPDGLSWWDKVKGGAKAVGLAAKRVGSGIKRGARAVGGFVVDEVWPRAKGAGKVIAGAGGMFLGATLCASIVGCAVGGPLFLISGDYGGSGLSEMFWGKPQKTTMWHAATSLGVDGDTAQALQGDIVEGAAIVTGVRSIPRGSGATCSTSTAQGTAAERAQELHSVLDPRAARSRTTAVVETTEGTRVVSSSSRRLTPAQRAALRRGEIEGAGAGHAEVTAVNFARALGLTPTGAAASRPICPQCATFLRQFGVDPLSPLK